MFCNNCGRYIKENTKFCPYCGNFLNNAIPDKESSTTRKKDKKDKKPNGKKINDKEGEKRKKAHLFIKIILVILILLIISAGVIFTLEYFDVINIPIVEDILVDTNIKEIPIDIVPEEYRVETIDAEKYYRENGNLEEIILVEESKEVLSEKECLSELADRGFGECEAFTEYTIKGTYIEEKSLSKWSPLRHPKYSCIFIDDNEMWLINIIENQVMASPIIYNAMNDKNIIVSEKEVVTCYDGDTNSFYKIIPSKDMLEVIQIQHIDADSLIKTGYGVNTD